MATTVTVPTNVSAPKSSASDGEGPWLDWVKSHKNMVLGVAGALLLVGAGAWFFMVAGARKESFAARALNQARSAAEAGNLPLASSELQKVSQTYQGTDAGKEAVLSLNQIRMINNQNELAIVGLREFLKTRPPAKFVAPSQGLLGAALENARQSAEAAAAYQAASAAAEVDYLRAEYLLDAARALKTADKREEAAKLLRSIVEKYPKTPAMTEAQVRLAELTEGKL